MKQWKVAISLAILGAIAAPFVFGRAFMRTIIIIGIVVATYASSVQANDYIVASDAAYCVGALRSEMESTDRMVEASGINEEFSKIIRKLKANILVHENIVKRSIERRKIDEHAAARITNAGYDDGNVCNKGHCSDELERRGTKTGTDEYDKMYKACTFESEKICERIRKACE
jgi:hypothetical protein